MGEAADARVHARAEAQLAGGRLANIRSAGTSNHENQHFTRVFQELSWKIQERLVLWKTKTSESQQAAPDGELGERRKK